MKKFFTLFTVSLLFLSSAIAQVSGTGFYRVSNSGLKSATGKDFFCRVVNWEVSTNYQSGMDQMIQALNLESGAYIENSDPAAIMYLKNPEDASSFDIQAQGLAIRKFLSSMELAPTGVGDYIIRATKSSFTGTLKYDTEFVDNHHYVCSTGGKGSDHWSIFPVNSDSEYDWFGIQPTLTAGGKHYASFYAGFSFKCKSQGMKVYVVSDADDSHFKLEELTGEIPAETPVLIECSSLNAHDNLIDIIAPSTPRYNGANKLTGVYYCNQYLSTDTFSGFITPFDSKTMRVFNVKDDQLVLSTDKAGLFEGTYRRTILGIDYRGKLFIKANSAYLPVSSSAATVLTQGTTAIYNVDASQPKVVSITNIAGQKVNSLVTGVNLIKYSDGTVKKVIK